ncbi:ATP-binding protein [Ideonella azotifigens]|uniref:histidine kinase n=1 Tax=Ideonella azotifigens TaxID=513160 RepID=A0ABP3V9U2_9BURK|nr:ATP-binding protein [Ideonella azotifigens]MCD2341563.1 ATP-binding protein [Ideonella azotifigens]
MSTHLKLSIGQRLFASILAAFLVVGAAGVGLVRWSLSGGAQASSAPDRAALDLLARTLAERFSQHRDWSFLPADAAQRQAWLRDTLAPATLGERLGLLNAQRQLLAGVKAHRGLIVVASIDTIERPVMVDGAKVGSLLLARAENPADNLAVAFLVQQQRPLAVLGGISLLLAALAAAALAANFRRPVRQLVDGARQLGAGHFDARLVDSRQDELGELARSFNQLAAQLAAAEDSRRQWVANTSHELRTPLAVLRSQLEALQDGVRHATPEHLALMHRQVLALARLVDELHDLARADVGRLANAPVPMDAWPLAVEVLRAFAPRFSEAGLQSRAGMAPAASRVRCDPERLRQVLGNLLENCVRYTERGGSIEVHGQVQDQALQLDIDDSAPDVPAAELPRLGERFFRVEASRDRRTGGAGLGLALSRQIIEANGGRLLFSSSPLGGLRARIVLPLESC